MLISFSGFSGSGKTTLCNALHVIHRYKVLNFADELKILVCEILDIDLDYLNDNKDVFNSFTIDKEKTISELKKRDIPISDMRDSFESIRDLLQYLGTDIIREHNPDWHIKLIYNAIENSTENICIGDCRFENEKEFVEKLGGFCFYIMSEKDYDDDDDYHISENTLTPDDFEHVLYNIDCDLIDFISSGMNEIHSVLANN
jgi:hypothetical protein